MKFELRIEPQCDEKVVATVKRRSDLTDQIEALVLQYTGDDQLTGYTEDEVRMLRLDEIELITVSEGKTWAVDVRGSTYRLKQRLYVLEEMLPACFIRINKSAIANEKHLVRFATGFSGAVDAVFVSGNKEYVSRRCFAEIKRRFLD